MNELPALRRHPSPRPAAHTRPSQSTPGMLLRRIGVAATTAMLTGAVLAATPLADQPVFVTTPVPGNLALALSVEFPTAISVAHIDNTFDANARYLGYFDPEKCYLYSSTGTAAEHHFYPAGAAVARKCTGADDHKWSGNFLNWATMQTIDPFRSALTGGYRSTDTATTTILERAWASNQGNNFPNRTITTAADVAAVTPFPWGQFRMRVKALGNAMRFTHAGNVDNTPTPYVQGMAVNAATTYDVVIRVKVCDTSPGAGPLEPNCQRYPDGNYKPVGLMQRYAGQIRYSAFGYLNDSNVLRDGGVLRARQKFIGPTYVLPGSNATANPAAEWSASNGVFVRNPDAADATATNTAYGLTGADGVADSGVLNYLNKFGQITPGTYKTYDNVGELYYAVLRYFKKQGNVPEWTSMSGATTATKKSWIDGFPVINNWDDPIQYSCQRNFVLGIGDVNTHADRNLPGASGSSEPAKPSAVSSDTTVNAVTATNKIGALHGIGAIGNSQPYNGCCTNNGALLAGLAYDANTRDLRPDDPNDLLRTKGRQSLQTYWLDVLEYQTYKANNQYYLAAKYGGFEVPEGFDPYARSTDIDPAWWRTNSDTVGTQPRPDTYFVAARPDQVVAGLERAFSSIAARMRSFTTAFSMAMPQVSSGGGSFATLFDSKSWTGELIASQMTPNATTGAPVQAESWRFSSRLDAQAAADNGAGWSTRRFIASWNNATALPVAFRLDNLSPAQKTALDTAYRSGNDATDFVNYLRGERKHEQSSSETGSAKAYRDRSTLLGDIGRFRARPVGRPDAPYSNSSNPGYSAFKSTWSARPTVVYVGTNAGVVHAVHGGLTGADAGKELFAYVPGAVIAGPSGTPAVDGLQALGNPEYAHRNFVDATPTVADVDLGRTVGGSGTDWRTILVGGLGKGGRAVYALDITNPVGVTQESHAVSRVLWEFTDPDLGFVYGEPAVVKTRKHGWVVIVGSGYNNADGKGYLFVLNPRNGALLEKLTTGTGSTTAQAGLAHVQAFLLDRTDATADAVYAGDLLGNLWRWDLTPASGTLPAALRLAQLKDSHGNTLAVTSRPLVVVHPENQRRYVTVGTGRLLHPSDMSSSQVQRFYAIIDGTASKFAPSDGSGLPGSVSYPIVEANLRQLTNLTQKVVLDLNSEVGWYLDLGTIGAGASWRVISDPTSFYGTVAFSVMQPVGASDPCETGGSNRVYAIDLGSGQSRLTSTPNPGPNPVYVPYLSTMSGVITDLRFYSVQGKARLIAGSDTGSTGSMPGAWGTTTTTRRLNWREVILND